MGRTDGQLRMVVGRGRRIGRRTNAATRHGDRRRRHAPIRRPAGTLRPLGIGAIGNARPSTAQRACRFRLHQPHRARRADRWNAPVAPAFAAGASAGRVADHRRFAASVSRAGDARGSSASKLPVHSLRRDMVDAGRSFELAAPFGFSTRLAARRATGRTSSRGNHSWAGAARRAAENRLRYRSAFVEGSRGNRAGVRSAPRRPFAAIRTMGESSRHAANRPAMDRERTDCHANCHGRSWAMVAAKDRLRPGLVGLFPGHAVAGRNIASRGAAAIVVVRISWHRRTLDASVDRACTRMRIGAGLSARPAGSDRVNGRCD